MSSIKATSLKRCKAQQFILHVLKIVKKKEERFVEYTVELKSRETEADKQKFRISMDKINTEKRDVVYN